VWVATRDYKIVGGALEALRKSAGVTQQELAKRLRKPQSFVSSYESGQRRLDLLELIKVIGAIGADPRSVVIELVDTVTSKRSAR
jgi:transcriptional regulator with XRE-family HTH domain